MYEQIDRTYLHHPTLDKGTSSSYKENQNIVPADGNKPANLISSVCEDGLHAPVIDIDYPIEVYPSSQMGHHHLYLNKKISFEQYKNLLLAMQQAGLVEAGYVDASIKAGYTAVRPVGVTKPGIPPNAKKLLEENAKLRQQVYELTKELHAQTNSHQSAHT